MAADNKSKSASTDNTTTSKKRKQRYLPHNKPVKKKGSYPLRPGVQGFFLTCDGGRERQASHEAINVIDSFYEELVHGNGLVVRAAGLPNKPLNKKIKFSYSESSGSDEEYDEREKEKEEEEEEEKEKHKCPNYGDQGESNGKASSETLDPLKSEKVCPDSQTEGESNDNKKLEKVSETQANEAQEPPTKTQCQDTNASKGDNSEKVEEKSIDKLIDAELKELGDKNKRRFFTLDSGCNGLVFIQMRKKEDDPSPKDIVQHIMTSAAATKKHMSRFILRVLPIEVACYASEEEIARAIKPLVEQYFPEGTENPQKVKTPIHSHKAKTVNNCVLASRFGTTLGTHQKVLFAVLYEARANTGINRKKIIDVVAKSVPGPHKVDLNNPDRTIVVEIIKTICLIGVIEKYKELAKYNLRQLTSPQT